MSAKPNDYSFESYLNWRLSIDYYDDDAFLKRTLKTFSGDDWQGGDDAARKISGLASRRWRQLADTSAQNGNQPKLSHYDAFGNRIDRIQRCAETESMEKEIFSLGLFSSKTSAWEKLIQLFLIYENGEAGISCPLACTDSLASLLDAYADTAELQHIRSIIREGNNGDYVIAAQFITEIQGGSDIASNQMKASEENGQWRLFGKKYFCSAAHADYFLVTAKPAGSGKVAAFVVPAWQQDGRESGLRNHYRIDRLKDKMGARELPTAEIEFEGAYAYPVAQDKDLADVIAIILTCSRLTIGIFSAAVMSRAVREATYYAEFRQAFGRPIGHFPMLKGQLERLQFQANRTTAGVFKFYQHLLKLEGGLLSTGDESCPINQRRHLFEIRELVMLQKLITAADSVEVLRTAISVFGGQGVIEDFSCLPRLFRDATVNELWESPRNALLSQIFRDLQQAANWYPVDEFVANLLKGSNKFLVKQLSRDMLTLVSSGNFDEFSERAIEQCEEWEQCCERLFHAYQDNAFAEVDKSI